MRKNMSQTVLREIGGLLVMLGAVMVLPALVSLIYAEWYSAAGFFSSAVVTGGIGLVLYRVFFRQAPEPENKDAMIIAALGWLTLAMMGTLPFLVIAHITPPEVMETFVPAGESYTSSLHNFKNPLHAFFESMSGFTSTGLTMSVHEPSVGKGVLFYRSLSQWIGGAGFIVMTLAILQDKPGPGLLSLYSSESSGVKLRPTVVGTARTIWRLYLGLTIFQMIYLIAGTLIILPEYPLADTLFDGINHALTGQATGGFSTLDNSIAGYDSSAMEMLYLLPMVMGALALPFYYRVINKRQFDQFWKDIQTRALLVAFVIGSIITSFFLYQQGDVANPLREGVFQFVSGLSQTGWQTSEIGAWGSVAVVFLVSFAMFIGGAVGSTVGGIKIKRALLIQKGLRWQVGKIFFPDRMIKTVKFDHKILKPQEMNEELAQASTLAFTYLLLVLASTVVTSFFMGAEFGLADALFESASAQGTVGLTTGITGPDMSPVVEITYIFQMWAGRLEIIPVIVLLRALFLGTDPRVI